jgi:hypothetical protein
LHIKAHKVGEPAELSRLQLSRGLWAACGFGLLFLIGTAVQSVATLLSKMHSDTMKAATGNFWTGHIGGEVVHFVLAQLALHLAFGVLAWALACATTVAWPSTRVRFGRVIVLWFCALAAAVIAYNALWFPRTGLGVYYHDLMSARAGPVSLGRLIYLAVIVAGASTMAAAAWATLRRIGFRRLRYPLAAGATAIALACASALALGHRGSDTVRTTNERPHIIMLGVDSLRLEYLKRFGGTGVTSHLDQFLAGADIVRDVTTPVARTYPSWTAILTGRSPTSTGVRFNLAPRDFVKVNPTIADLLRQGGYHTIYSTDEVRFANFDETYGFDQVVTPPIGAADFVLGNYNELPLVSVIANTRLGQWLFPYSYANRGAATLFQPHTYLSRLEREVSFDQGPTFFIAHLTASHWPSYVSDTPLGASEKANEEDRPVYRLGLRTADEMFGGIVEMLERKGALDNAIVVVLSDHGEALGLNSDTMLDNKSKVEGLRAPLLVQDFGHGQSVLSPVQYQVLLGFRTFGPAAAGMFAASGRDLAGAATVEDIAPTLLDLARLPVEPLHPTGESFARLLRGDPGLTRVGSAERVRFTETDLRVLPSTDGGVDEAETAKQNSRFFEVNRDTGRMSIKRSFMPLSIAYKERAAYTDDLLLAAIPAGPDAHQYLLLDRKTHNGRLLLEPPPADAGAERRLWDALSERYGDELRRPVSITMKDWPIIEAQWNQFFVNREARDKAAAGG